MISSMNQPANPAGEVEVDGDWKSFVHSTLALDPCTPVSKVHDSLRALNRNEAYAAIVESGKPIGIISRTSIGFLLGSKYGHSLFGGKPAHDYMLEQYLCIRQGMSCRDVLSTALSRPDPFFYHDVVLVDRDGAYLGLINVHVLVYLQTSILSQTQDKVGSVR